MLMDDTETNEDFFLFKFPPLSKLRPALFIPKEQQKQLTSSV